jgi:hypothetical protein
MNSAGLPVSFSLLLFPKAHFLLGFAQTTSVLLVSLLQNELFLPSCSQARSVLLSNLGDLLL